MFQAAFTAVKIAATNPMVQAAAVTVGKKVAINFAINVAASAAIKTTMEGIIYTASARSSKVEYPKRTNSQKVKDFGRETAFYSKEFGKNIIVALSSPAVYVAAVADCFGTTGRTYFVGWRKNVLTGTESAIAFAYVSYVISKAFKSFSAERERFTGDMTDNTSSEESVATEVFTETLVSEEEVQAQFESITNRSFPSEERVAVNIEVLPDNDEDVDHRTIVLDMERVTRGSNAKKLAYGRELNHQLVDVPDSDISFAQGFRILDTALSIQIGKAADTGRSHIMRGFTQENEKRRSALARATKTSGK